MITQKEKKNELISRGIRKKEKGQTEIKNKDKCVGIFFFFFSQTPILKSSMRFTKIQREGGGCGLKE